MLAAQVTPMASAENHATVPWRVDLVDRGFTNWAGGFPVGTGLRNWREQTRPWPGLLKRG